MKISLADRVARIISGGFNQLVSAMENAVPETVMEQAIREVDGAIDDVRAELGQAEAKLHLASKRLADANSRHEDLTTKVDVAVGEGREDLAEAAIAQQLDLEAQIPVLESAIAEAGERKRELEGFVTALQAKKREMLDELRGYRRAQERVAAGQAAGSGTAAGSGSAGDARARAERAGSVFDRVLERQTGLPGAGGDLGNAGKLAELDGLARQRAIRERLEAAKARAGQD